MRITLLLALLLTTSATALEKIQLSPDHRHFILADSKKSFTPFGFNYLGRFGELTEESWATDWATVEKDFRDMRALGANVVRVHLQFSTYMKSATEADPAELARLRKMLDL